MTPDVDGGGNLWHWAIHGVLASYAALLTWLGKGVIDDVTILKKTDGACRLDLANFRTEVANTYSKDVSVQASLGRLHDRLDDSQEAAEENFKELRSNIGEIKNLLIGKNRHG